jgi:SAM-dependent methyltransferase
MAADATTSGDTPLTWHYGLLARWWAEVNEAGPDELAYYHAAVERNGEPALDLGCGTGRLLVPLLRAGLDVDGTDVSPDMLQRARLAGEAAGIDMEGRLAQQTFAGLELTRTYRTIFCCDSFGIGGSRAADELALRRIHDHLAPGGAFIFSIDLLVPGAFDALTIPEPWPDAKARARLDDGDELELLRRTASWDPGERVEVMEIRARLWRDGQLLAEEEGSLAFVHYTVDELRAMLAAAGIDDFTLERPYSGRPSDPGDETVVFVARRPRR